MNDRLCKHCEQPQSVHDDWIATGEYGEKCVCPSDMDELGRYRKLIFFEPMNNLEYLEYKSNEQS